MSKLSVPPCAECGQLYADHSLSDDACPLLAPDGSVRFGMWSTTDYSPKVDELDAIRKEMEAYHSKMKSKGLHRAPGLAMQFAEAVETILNQPYKQ